MQSLRDRNKTKNSRIKIGVAIGVLVILLIVAPFVVPSVGNAFRVVLSPVWKIQNNLSGGVKNFFANFASKRSLKAQNEMLSLKLREQEAQMIDHRLLLAENESLKEIVGRKNTRTFVLGSVLVKPNRSLYDTLIIDVGSKDSIVVGALVYAYGVVPIGKITNVSNTDATVTLFSTAGQKTIARVESQNIDVELVGRGGGNFEIKVPRDVVLEPDTNLFLPGLADGVVAVVVKNITDVRDSVQTFILTTVININELNWVEVVK